MLRHTIRGYRRFMADAEYSRLLEQERRNTTLLEHVVLFLLQSVVYLVVYWPLTLLGLFGVLALWVGWARAVVAVLLLLGIGFCLFWSVLFGVLIWQNGASKRKKYLEAKMSTAAYSGRETKVFTLLHVVAFFAIAYFINDDLSGRLLAFAFMFLALVLGYFIGVLISPYSKKEESDFKKIMGAISLFISGFVLSKLEPVITAAITSAAFYNEQNMVTIIGSTGCFLSALIVVFVHRRYVFDTANTSDVEEYDEEPDEAPREYHKAARKSYVLSKRRRAA